MTDRDQSYFELYDIVKDPLEKENSAEQEPAVVAELHDSITSWIETLPSGPTGDVFSSL